MNESGREITINHLYEADTEAPAHPENKYEIADGVVVGMRKPTYGLQKRFEEADEPVQELFAGQPPDRRGEEIDEKEVSSSDLAEGVTLRKLRETILRCAIAEAQVVLDVPEDLDADEIFGPMAIVVRSHFMTLSDGIGAVVRLSSPGGATGTE